MARTVPVHTGYTIINGTGSGSNGGRIDVWVEYRLGTPSTTGNYTPVTAYFYAALNPSYTSTTSYSSGLNSTFTVSGNAGSVVKNGAYDFTSANRVNLLGSYSGNIAHNADGTGKLVFSGTFTTASAYISGGSVSANVTLPAIPQAARVTALDVTLGEKCCLQWTPASADHSFTATFSLGSWSLTTMKLRPNSTKLVTYTGTVLPLTPAAQFKTASAKMAVTLTTYAGQTELGSHRVEFTVTVPENASTRPNITATLLPECARFPGLYVQRLGKVRAQATATDPYGADITGWQILVDGAATKGLTSDFLEKSGTLPVKVQATSSRGFTGTWEGQITVLAYDRPHLQATAYRCLSDGTADPGGTYLWVDAHISCSPLAGQNTGTLQWRYKVSGGSYADWLHLTASGIAPGVVLEKDRAYSVHLQVTDTAGSVTELHLAIPTEQVYLHRTPNGLGIGGYVQEQGLLDVHWDLSARKGINGAYIRTLTPVGKSFSIRLSTQGQTVFVVGSGVQGLISGGQWIGTTGVTATFGNSAVTLTLPASGSVLLLSPNPIEI